MEHSVLPEDAIICTLRGVSGSGTYEAHITVDAPDDQTRARFRECCAELGVKAVLIDLREGVNPTQPMTSSYHRGTLAEAANAAAEIARGLRHRGFAIARVKLEAIATNPGVPSDADVASMPSDCYFEFHVKLLLRPDSDEPRLKELCKTHDAHLSRNAFKTRSDGLAERFATMRVYRAGKESAFRRLDALTADLIAAGFEIVNTQREYSLFDSHVGLDAGWLDAPSPVPQ